MELVKRNSALWYYLPKDIKGLLLDGEVLLEEAEALPGKISDFSFLVFPFSKAYEGFLKKILLDLGLIREDEYYGDDIRIGRILNPKFIHEHENVFDRLGEGSEMAHKLWGLWKVGRNQVFHYFPHNFRKLEFEEAKKIIEDLVEAMGEATEVFGFPKEN